VFLAILTVLVMASLVVTEIILARLLRETNIEVRRIRAEVPKAAGLVVGVVLLVAAVSLASGRGSLRD